MSSEGQKCVLDVRGELTVWYETIQKATGVQTITCYKQRSAEPFLNAKNSKLREPFTQVHNVGLKLGQHGLVC